MGAPFGIVNSGFSLKTLSDILADVNAKLLAGISTSLDLQSTSIIGVQNGILGDAVSELWLVLAALYNGMDPDQATGEQLVSLALITGTSQLDATKTQVPGCSLSIANTFVSAAPGTMFASISGNPAAQFTNKTTVSFPGGGSPQTVTVDFEAVNTGPIQALSGTLTVKAQPLTGWISITNPTDGVIGSNIETDVDLRLRRQEELSQAGASTADAIRSAVLSKLVPPTTTSITTGCTVLWNDTDLVDANGLPPHSLEVIALQQGNTSADDQALAELIAAEKASGIGTHGTASKVVTDTQGITEQIFYTRPTPVPIYVDITVLRGANYPANGDLLIKAAIQAFGASQWQPGVLVSAAKTEGSAMGGIDLGGGELTAPIPGISDITLFKIDIVSPPVASVSISIDIRHQAVPSTVRVFHA